MRWGKGTNQSLSPSAAKSSPSSSLHQQPRRSRGSNWQERPRLKGISYAQLCLTERSTNGSNAKQGICMALLIDTHVWIWWLTRLPRLSPKIISALDEMPERPLLSVASLWELSLLVESGALELTPSPSDWLEKAIHPETVQLAQITRSVAE